MDRRDFLRVGAGAGVGALAVGAGTAVAGRAAARERTAEALASHSAAYRHSVARWCFAKMSVNDLAAEAKRLGMHSVELLSAPDWAVVKQHGLTCAMGYAEAGDARTRLTKGWNRVEHHEWLLPGYREGLTLAAAAGVPNIICFSGNREGLDDAKGLDNCAAGLRQLMPDAERLGVTVAMELFNTKIDHPDYQCDSTRWGADLVEKVGSDRFRLLYDIYHMQIMEGDVIRTLRDHRQHIAHIHVAGVPGRHEPDATQELNYPAIVRALAEMEFPGYVAQEFIVTKPDPIAALADAVRICSV